ncbi:MAG TPA: ABC transporter substrate-binding protein [Actinomycetota bacterium]
MRPLALALSFVWLMTACAAREPARTSALHDDAVTIASFNFQESELLAELYAQALEARGIRVERQMGLGPREIVQPSLESGLVELVPEYAGSLLEFLAGEGSASSTLVVTLGDLEHEFVDRGLVALDPAAAQNQNSFVVTQETADRFGLQAVSDLAEVEDLTLGGPPECPQRPLCQLGLERRYDVFSDFVALDQSGPLTTDALIGGVIDVALFFSTSPQIVQHGLVVLEDDRQLQPAENILPVVHRAALQRFGSRLSSGVDAVSRLLTTQELRALNAALTYGEATAAEAARGWLLARGLVPAPG